MAPASHFADIISETSDVNGDTKTNAQRPSGCIGSLFSRKPGAVAHFADIISETSDVNVPGPYRNTVSKPETPNTKTSPKQLTTEVETIQIDSEDETDTAPTTSRPQIYDPNNPYTYQCNLSQEKLDKLAEDDDEEMDDDSLKAFLNILRIESGKPVILVSSHYRKRVLRLGLTKSLYDGDLKNFETAIIPIHMPNTEAAHWVLGIYRRNESILYFDSIGITYGMVKSKDGMTLELVTNWISETLKSAVRDITRDTQLDPKIEAVPLDGPQFDHHRPKYRINPQMDGVNCGFHIALIAEAFLMNNGDVFLENFDIATERTRILDILSGLRDDNYRYIPRNVHNTPKDVDIDLEMQQSDNDMNASDKISDFCKNATMEKETVAKSVKNDHEKAPVPEMMNQLVENAEAFTLENDWPKASNNGQSPGSATNSDEALPNPEQKSDHEMSSVEVDSAKLSQLLNKIKAFILENDKENASYQRQSPGSATNSDEALPNPEQEIEVNTLPMATDQQPILCKGTEVPEKPDPEANAQPKTNVQRENLSKDETEKDTNERENEMPKSNNDSSAESENLRKKVVKLEANPAKSPEQFENDRLYSILEEYANATELHAKQISELSQKHSQTLASLKSELQLLCQNYKTSQDVALEVARPQLEQSHNALAIDQALPKNMLDHSALTDCPSTSLPFLNQQSDIDEMPIEEREVAPSIDFSHLISTLFYPDAISSVITENEVEINTADHFHGIIEELQNSDLTCANATVTDSTLIRERNEVQSTVNSSASSVITASDMSIPTKFFKCAKAKHKHIASKVLKLSIMPQEQSSTNINAEKLRNTKKEAKMAKLTNAHNVLTLAIEAML
ncbi:hypothetical protein Ddc_23235 [Ditylenchus destructor]|nr:hypothetical protein Ddc_23235 [Ditylenchus destructor]